jgi:hypothetical protein
MSRRHPVCDYRMVGDSWICLLTLASFGAVDELLFPYRIGEELPTKRPEFVSLQVEHKQFIGNGHLVDSSLR